MPKNDPSEFNSSKVLALIIGVLRDHEKEMDNLTSSLDTAKMDLENNIKEIKGRMERIEEKLAVLRESVCKAKEGLV